MVYDERRRTWIRGTIHSNRFLDLLLDGLADEGLVVRNVVQLGSEGVAGSPFGRKAGRNLGHAHVGLLEGQTLEFGDEEVGERHAEAAETTPEEKHLRTEVGFVFTDEIRGNDGY